jgi:oligosaccharide repeat unit polymerase
MKNTVISKGLAPFVFAFASLFLFSIVEWGLGLFSKSVWLTNLYIIQLFTIWGLSFSYSTKHLGIMHIFSLLLLTIFFFTFGGIFASFFSSDFGFRVAYSPEYIVFPEETIQKVLLIYCIFLSALSFSYFIWGAPTRMKKGLYAEGIDKSKYASSVYFDLGRLLMILLTPFALWYTFTMFNTFAGSRTMIYASGSNAELGIPVYLRISNMLFTTGFFLMVASTPSRKNFVRYSLLYLLTLTPLLLMGERGMFIAPIVFILWYQYRVYGVLPNMLKLSLLAVAIMVVSYVISFTRLGASVDMGSLFTILLAFIGTSSTSFDLMSFYITYQNSIPTHRYPFIFDSLIGGLTGQYGQSLETLEQRASIGHQLVYTINPDYYFSGASTGTSLVAEGFEFGIVGVIIAALLLAFFLRLLDKWILKKRFTMIFIYLLFDKIILSPRGSLFVPLYDIFKYTAVVIVIAAIYNIFRKNSLRTILNS